VTKIQVLLSPQVYAGNGNQMIIDELLNKDNYANSLWVERGLNPSSEEIKLLMSQTTKKFLSSLKNIASNKGIDETQKSKLVSSLADDLPWDELDTEEKEFIADVLAPAIQSIGLNPWAIF
jgi:hypothetical protein